jgi:hypothetical protein
MDSLNGDPFDPFAPEPSFVAESNFDPFDVGDPFADPSKVSQPAQLNTPFNPFDAAESQPAPARTATAERRLSNKGKDLLAGFGGLSVSGNVDPFGQTQDNEDLSDDDDSLFDPFANETSTQHTGFKLEEESEGASAELKQGEQMRQQQADILGDDEYIAVFPPHQKLGMLLQQGPFSTVRE